MNLVQPRNIQASIRTWLPWLLLLFLSLALPKVVEGYILRTFTVFYIYLLLAIGLTVIVNYAGLLNLGFIAFFGVGAYTYAVLNREYGLPFFAALPLGAVAAAILGLVIGFPTLRVRGDYLALVTLGFGEIVRIILLNVWGPHGIPSIPPPLPANVIGGGGNFTALFYWVALAPVPVALMILHRLDRARIARRWFALRDNEIAASACGINPLRSLLLALVIGTAFAGAAGVVFAGVQRYVSPASFVLDESILVLCIVVIAGGRSLWRLLLAAALLTFLPEVLRGLADYRMLIFGATLSAYVLFAEKWKTHFSRISVHQPTTAATPESRTARELPRFLAPSPVAAPVRLEVRNLSKRFDGVAALDDISITLNFDRSIIGLIGPNGAGKTTLFNCISGAVQPTSGRLFFPGLPVRHLPHHAAMAGIGRTFQSPNLFQSMSVRENVAMGSISGRPPLLDDQIDELLVHCGLSDVADCEVAALPLGTQRRIELARALALQPRLLLLDEIAAGLGTGEKQSLSNTIRRLAKDGKLNFLVVEHDMDFILPLAEHIVVLDAGRLLAQGNPEQISKDPAVINAYLGGHHAAA